MGIWLVSPGFGGLVSNKTYYHSFTICRRPSIDGEVALISIVSKMAEEGKYSWFREEKCDIFEMSYFCHSRGGGNLGFNAFWIPAFARMT